MTINRKVANYLAGTLASLRTTSAGLNYSIIVCVGNEDISHIPTAEDVSIIGKNYLQMMPGRGVLYAITANMAHAYAALDAIKGNADVASWYQKNIVLYSGQRIP